MANLTIKPSQIEIVLKPGAGYIQSYLITNNSDSDIVLSANVEEWLPQGYEGNVRYLPAKTDYFLFSLSNSDLSLNQNFILKANETRQLVLKFLAKDNTLTSDHYFTFFVNQQPQTDTGTNSLLRLGSHLLVSVNSTENPTQKFTVTEFSSSPYLKDILFGQVNFSGLIENQTSFFQKIDGQIIITKNQKPIETLNLYGHNVLSHHQRYFSCRSEKNEPIPCQLSPPLWPGVYTATLKTNHSPDVNLSFFVFPFYLVILITITFLSFFTIKRYLANKK
jgi:hypothetical protein